MASDNCASLQAHYAVYSIPQAAALRCGVPEDMINKILSEVEQIAESGLGRSIYRHPGIKCLEARSRAIAEAIENGDLPYGREDARPVDFSSTAFSSTAIALLRVLL